MDLPVDEAIARGAARGRRIGDRKKIITIRDGPVPQVSSVLRQRPLREIGHRGAAEERELPSGAWLSGRARDQAGVLRRRPHQRRHR